MERVWWSRLRWRLRGAWMWPTFLVVAVFDAVLLHELPIAGEDGTDLVPALLLAGFFNLLAVAVIAPFVGMLVRRRRPSLPRTVATDYAGTALVIVVAVALLAGGLIHRPAVEQARRERAAQLAAAQRYVLMRGPAEFRGHIALADSVQLGDHLFRTCVPGAEARRAMCVVVDTGQAPPGVTLDRSGSPNAAVVGGVGR